MIPNLILVIWIQYTYNYSINQKNIAADYSALTEKYRGQP